MKRIYNICIYLYKKVYVYNKINHFFASLILGRLGGLNYYYSQLLDKFSKVAIFVALHKIVVLNLLKETS